MTYTCDGPVLTQCDKQQIYMYPPIQFCSLLNISINYFTDPTTPTLPSIYPTWEEVKKKIKKEN